MTTTTSEKIQPWRTQWPPASHGPSAHGTKHGFTEGQTVVLDGNAVGLSMPKSDQSKDTSKVEKQ